MNTIAWDCCFLGGRPDHSSSGEFTMKNTFRIMAAVAALAIGGSALTAPTSAVMMMKHHGMMMKKY
jgi:hypothetical protein